MAEAAAVIGLVASIAALVDLSTKVVSRVRDYSERGTEAPKTFRALADRLPLLTRTLTRVQSRARAGHVKEDAAKELHILIESICEQVKLVKDCLDDILPASDQSRLERVRVGLKSLAKDEKVNQAVEKIHYGIDVLVLHQTTSAVEVGDHILQELSQLNLQSATSQQAAPDVTVQRACGLCLGQAPLIDPDSFLGRKGEIKQLHQWLSPLRDAAGQQVVSIVGMGGLGKTQLSLAYARKHGHEYSSVFWLSAKDRVSLRQSMAGLAAVIFPDSSVAAVNADEESRQVEQVRCWLSEASNDQWLLIFDNYDDPSLPNTASTTGFDIRQFFPMRVQGSILITTRSPKLAFSKPLKLQKLQSTDLCIAVLSQRSGRDMVEDPDSRQLAARLDGLPLALAVAGTYLAQTNVSCAEYLELYNTAWNDLHGLDGEELMEYEDRRLSSTWTVSLNQVRRQDADVAELLQFIGYLNNDDIWYELIKKGAEWGPPWMDRVTANKIRFDRAMSKLGDYSLVDVVSRSYRVHPCLHDWIFEHLNTPLSESLFITTIMCLERNFIDALDPQYWKVNQRLIKHVDRLQHPKFTVLWHSNNSNETVLDACHSFGILYYDLCEFARAENMFRQALVGKERLLGPEHASTLLTVRNLGALYVKQGKLLEGEQMSLRTLSGCEKTLGLEHTSTLNAVNALGGIYLGQGKLAESLQLLKRALAGKEKVLGPEHQSTLDTVGNLGLLYSLQDKPVEAEQMLLRSLKGREKILGSEHMLTLDIVNNLGIVYLGRGMLVEGEQMLLRALGGRKKILGLQHTSTLYTIHHLGLLYYNQGKLGKGEQMLLQALEGNEKLFGTENIATLETVNKLGFLYSEQGKLAEAEQMLLRALRGREKVLGPEHMSTLEASSSLGVLYSDQGKPEAEQMLLRALSGKEKILGRGHTSTLSTVSALGNLYRIQGKLVIAEQMLTRALTGLEEVVGPDHTSTLYVAHGLGRLYADQGKLDKAEQMYLRALSGYEKVPLLRAPCVFENVYHLGLLYKSRGELDNATAMFQRALQGRREVLGADHPDTQKVVQALSTE